MGDISSGVFLLKDLPITPVLEAGQHYHEAVMGFPYEPMRNGVWPKASTATCKP